MKKYDLPESLLLFITEHDPYHFKEDKLAYHLQNAAYLPKSLYFANIESPRVRIFPWVLYHNQEIQTKFMWFSGPNEVDTKMEEINMLPLGCSMKFLFLLQGDEVAVRNSIDGKDLVFATTKENSVVVEIINYSESRNVSLTVQNLTDVFPDLNSQKLKLRKYVINGEPKSYLHARDTSCAEAVEEVETDLTKDELTLNHQNLGENGIILWELLIGESMFKFLQVVVFKLKKQLFE